jgi:predicted GIY-YIG superfamily endonuclease
MLSKMRQPKEGGSRIGIVFNGSPLFTGDAGSGESNSRQWIIENDWLEAVVALPDQLFYNTGISTYIWILTNRKEAERRGKIHLIDARQFYVKMRKSLGNKRNKIGDKDEGEPDQIGEIAKIHGNFRDGETRMFTIDGQQKTLVVSKIFDNADFGFHKITVERPLRLNFQANVERIARIKDESGFKNLATSNKKNEKVRLQEIADGEKRQEEIRRVLRALGEMSGEKLYMDRESFLADLKSVAQQCDVRLSAAELKAVQNALGERDETAEICRDKDGSPEPDPELRDNETVPLKESIENYFKREVLPHVPDLPAPRPRPGQFCIYVLKCADDSFYIGQTDNFERRLSEHRSGQASWTAPRLPVEPSHWEIFESRELAVKREKELKTGFGRKWLKREYDAGRLAAAARQAGAWIDHSKTKVGYEIPLNRHFYRYEPPRPLEEIEADIKTLESEILALLKEVTA